MTQFVLSLQKKKKKKQDETKRSIQLRNLMPFGGGMRLCVGAEFSKLFISLFLQVLVPKYRYRVCVSASLSLSLSLSLVDYL